MNDQILERSQWEDFVKVLSALFTSGNLRPLYSTRGRRSSLHSFQGRPEAADGTNPTERRLAARVRIFFF